MMKGKYLALIFLLLSSVVLFMTGTSYALLKGSTVSKNNHVITTGTLEIKLNENFENIEKGIGTINDVTAILNEEFYEFTVTNTSDIACKYKLYLMNEAPSDYTGKLIPNDYIRVGLEVNNKEIGPIGLALSKNVIDTNSLKSKEVNSYKLRVWFDESKKAELKKMTDYKAFLKLKVVAEQEI